MAKILSGKAVADAMYKENLRLKDELFALGIRPGLAIMRFGGNKSDIAYEKAILKLTEALSILTERHILDEDCPTERALKELEALNAAAHIHGILIFKPLKSKDTEEALAGSILAEKDVDGMGYMSMAGLYYGKNTCFPPCTARACIELCRHYEIPLEGAEVAVCGRSLVIGKPVSLLLLRENATVTICHSRTKDLKRILSRAQIVVSAMGKAEFLDKEFFSPGQTVIDVGSSYSEKKNSMTGDVDFDEVSGIVGSITPYKGGLGSITVSCLIRNLVEAAKNLNK